MQILKNELLKIMAAFAIASFRIMPALTRIIVAINTVNFMLPALDSYDKLIRILNRSKKKLHLEKKLILKNNIKNLTLNISMEKFILKIFLQLSIKIKK